MLAQMLRKAAQTPLVSTWLCRLGETYLGSHLLFRLLLRPLTERSLQVRKQAHDSLSYCKRQTLAKVGCPNSCAAAFL